MPKYTLLVLTNAAEGREDDFNDWYTHTHIGDVLKVPGIVGAQRFKLAGAQLGPAPHPWGYLALYDVETNDLETVMKTLRERIGTPAMVMSDAMRPELIGLTFEAITPPVAARP